MGAGPVFDRAGFFSARSGRGADWLLNLKPEVW
jgi:hypothetical protein